VTQASYQLYGRHGSGSDVVRMLLEEVGAQYQFIEIGREPADVAAYRARMLTDKVPALVLPQGTAMFESAAICLYLAAAHPGARLAPASGSVDYAHYLQWMVYLSANLYECALRIYYASRYSRAGEAAAGDIRQKAGEDFLQIVGLMVPALSPYLLGEHLSTADHYLYVLGGWYPDGRAALDARWPALARHSQLMSQRPAVRKVEALA